MVLNKSNKSYKKLMQILYKNHKINYKALLNFIENGLIQIEFVPKQ